MSSALKQRIQDDIKVAMRNKDKQRLSTLRLVASAIKQREVDERIELDDSQIISVLEKMIKQRHDSLGHYEAAGREDLVAQEAYELTVLQDYMPQPLTEDELAALIDEAIAETGADSAKAMGQVIAALKPKVQGRADMRTVSGTVKKRLSA